MGGVVKLKVKKGIKALYIGEDTANFRNEHELLIERGHSCKITKYEYNELGYNIEAEII